MIIFIVGIVLIAAAVCGALWFLMSRVNPPLPAATVQVTSTVPSVPSSTSVSAAVVSGENPQLATETLQVDRATFIVEIAQTMLQQTSGLSFRSSLAPGYGMLFLFGAPAIQTFWMKDMNFPLDMIWIGGGKVLGFAQNAVPQPGAPLWELKLYTSPPGTNTVLEVPAGTVAQRRHPGRGFHCDLPIVLYNRGMAKTRIAINGFGRIGRLFFKAAFTNPNFEIVALNDLGDVENLAYLLKYDTVYGRYDKEVKADVANGKLIVDGKDVAFLQIKDPTQLPWKDLNIDIAIESTGLFDEYEKAKVHLTAGAKRVVITAPARDEDGPNGKTVLMGVNEDEARGCAITSNGSCTTNSASPVIQVLSENPGIVKAMLSTVHAYTATQSIVDGPIRGGKDYRRGRAAAQNTSPSTTGAAISVTRAIPSLKGMFDGLSFRIPNITGSISDITFLAKRKTSAEEINQILTDAAATPRWQGIMKVTRDQLVSSDIIDEPFGAIVDLGFTKVVDGDMVKVLSWYDNEAGYVSTLVKHVEKVSQML